MQTLTERQQEVLDAIDMYIQKNHIPPTIAELCFLMKIKSTFGVRKHLQVLEKKGYITKKKSSARTIVITKQPA
jgi:repressor LexA